MKSKQPKKKNHEKHFKSALKSGKILEATGLYMISERKYKDADQIFKRAAVLYANSEDQLRIRLLRAQGKVAAGDKESALEILSNSLSDFKGDPGIEAVTSIADQIRKE